MGWIILSLWLLSSSAQYVPGEMLISFNDEMAKHMAQEACKANSATIMLTGDEYLDRLGREHGLIALEHHNLTRLCSALEAGNFDTPELRWKAKFVIDSDIKAIAELYAASEYVRYAEPNYIAQPASDNTTVQSTSSPVPIKEPAEGNVIEPPAITPDIVQTTLPDMDYKDENAIVRLLMPGLLCLIATVGLSSFVLALGLTIYRRIRR